MNKTMLALAVAAIGFPAPGAAAVTWTGFKRAPKSGGGTSSARGRRE